MLQKIKVTKSVKAVFERSDLKYNYVWAETVNNGTPMFSESDVIDKGNGEDVLNFLNRFFTAHGLSSHITFYRLEYLLYKYYSKSTGTRKELTSWMRKNWHRSFDF